MYFPLCSFGRRRRGRTAPTWGRGTLLRRLASSAPVIAALFVVGGMLGPFAAAAHAATTQAVVSLTFDDGDEDQYTNAFPVLQQHGLHGTFYIITGFVGDNSGNMTLSQLHSLYNAGNEIGGHTVLHPDLAEVSASEATRRSSQAGDPSVFTSEATSSVGAAPRRWAITATDIIADARTCAAGSVSAFATAASPGLPLVSSFASTETASARTLGSSSARCAATPGSIALPIESSAAAVFGSSGLGGPSAPSAR